MRLELSGGSTPDLWRPPYCENNDFERKSVLFPHFLEPRPTVPLKDTRGVVSVNFWDFSVVLEGGGGMYARSIQKHVLRVDMSRWQTGRHRCALGHVG